MDQLRAITTFIRAVQAGSISGAARALGLTPQAASKHILNLEQWAGVRLFNRTTHKISLTEEGIAFYERCKPAVESIEEGLIGLRDVTKDPVGTVRVAGSTRASGTSTARARRTRSSAARSSSGWARPTTTRTHSRMRSLATTCGLVRRSTWA